MLETIWFVLWGVLWAVYFVLDGYDLGMGTLSPFLGKTERDKRVMLNAAGAFWDGNEVWLLTAGGVTFAAFPGTYAVMFSSLYTPLMLLLFALILRGVSFEFRSKVESEAWRNLWDKVHFLGSFLPALLLGVAFANIFKGVPIDAAGINQGNLFTLLNPYGLAGGLLFVAVFCMHGAIWLNIRAEGELSERALATAIKLWPVVTGLAVLFLLLSAIWTNLFNNYLDNPILFVVLFLAVAGLFACRIFLGQGGGWKAFGASGVAIACTALFGVIGIYPALLPSSLSPAFSMTISNSASSPLTLKIMLGVAAVFVPLVLAYQTWSHIKLSHKITDEDLDHEEAY